MDGREDVKVEIVEKVLTERPEGCYGDRMECGVGVGGEVDDEWRVWKLQ